MKEKQNILLELKSEFSKVSGYKVNYAKLIGKEIYTAVSLGIIKNVQGLYNETENIAERK